MTTGFSHNEICIDKRTFKHSLETDGVCYINVESLQPENVLMINDEGGTSDENGMEHRKQMIVLPGE